MGTQRRCTLTRLFLSLAVISVVLLYCVPAFLGKPSSVDVDAKQTLKRPSSSIVVDAGTSSESDAALEKDMESDAVHQKEMLGSAPWAAHITEFLSTAPRSNTPEKLCSSQGRTATLGYLHASSKCPAWTWLKHYETPNNEGRPAVFVDIGCNKGYSTASFYEHFAPDSNVSHKTLCEKHKALGTKKYTGVCRDCFETPTFGKSSAHAPQIFCIDGSPRTHIQTKQIADQFKTKSSLVSGWSLFHLAVSNSSGFLDYEDCDNEDCGIARSGGQRKNNNTIRVPKTSYDDFVKLHGLGYVDLVKLDTEGEEPLIIQGMHESLKANRVGFLAFEISGNGKGWYSAYAMSRIVDLLDAYGYDCYVDTGDQQEKLDVIPFLTGCKGKRFDQTYSSKKYMPGGYLKIRGLIPQWGNAVCGSRKNQEIKHILSRTSTCGQHCSV